MSGAHAPAPALYGLVAEFDEPTNLVAAARRAYAAGYRKMDAYSPIPIEGLHEELGFHTTRLPLIVLIGGLVGLCAGYGLEYWSSVHAYPMNIGGRPLHSWPSFIPVAFETTILGAALSAVLGMLALNGLPEPYHPIFNAPRFRMASRHSFFLCIEAKDKQFSREATEAFLKSLEPMEVTEVGW